jgi:hypothetical protein
MPESLTTVQLETIQRLLVDPLRETVRTELQAGHERLTGAIEKVADQLARHVAASVQNELARDVRITRLEKRVATLEKFRGRLLAAYTALVLLCSLAWSLVRDWIVNNVHRR